MYLVVGLLLTTVAQAATSGGPCKPAETAQDILNVVQTSTNAVDICLANTGCASYSQLYLFPVPFAWMHIVSQLSNTILYAGRLAV